MIALKDNTFRSIYRNIQAPSKEEISTVKNTILEAHKLKQCHFRRYNKAVDR